MACVYTCVLVYTYICINIHYDGVCNSCSIISLVCKLVRMLSNENVGQEKYKSPIS